MGNLAQVDPSADKVSNLLGQHWGCMEQAHMSHSKPLLGKTAAATTLEGLIQVAL
jgi:hypothetical protein